jgi:hypothetical protein
VSILVAVADSESVLSETGAARSEALGFSSRATTTSCARICPATERPQSKAMKNCFDIKSAVITEFDAIGKRLI